jgi:peptidoglycan hydrolase-like protein with peptidoglycan-binding domain
MTETPTHVPTHKEGSSFLKRKVLGVPMVALLGVGVAGLAFYAWKSKSNAAANTTAATAVTGTPAVDTSTLTTFDANGNPVAGGLYDQNGNLLPAIPLGTVVVAPQPPPTSTNSSITTNDEWLSAGVAYLITQDKGPGDAQVALQSYLNGDTLTYIQGGLRDSVIRQLGLPPNPPTAGLTQPPVIPPKTPVVAPPVTPVPKPVPIAPRFTKYFRKTNGDVYGVTASGQTLHLTPAQWQAIVAANGGKPPAIYNEPEPGNPAPKAPVNMPTVSYPGRPVEQGSTGPSVVLVQRKVGATADGIFGPATKASVVNYQRANGLAADGVVGPATWSKMFG